MLARKLLRLNNFRIFQTLFLKTFNRSRTNYIKKLPGWSSLLKAAPSKLILGSFTGVTLMAASPPRVPDARLEQADQMYEESKFDELYQLLKDLDSPTDEVLWRLARVSYEIGRASSDSDTQKSKFDEAFQYISQALELGGENFAVHKWYAILLDKVSELKGTKERIVRSMEVKEHLQKAVELNPADATSYYVLGEWCYSFATLPWYQKKVASVIFATPPSSTLEEALSYYEKAEASSPLFYSLNLLKLGQVYLELGRREDATQTLLKLRTFKPTKNDDHMAIKKAEELLKKLGH